MRSRTRRSQPHLALRSKREVPTLLGTCELCGAPRHCLPVGTKRRDEKGARRFAFPAPPAKSRLRSETRERSLRRSSRQGEERSLRRAETGRGGPKEVAPDSGWACAVRSEVGAASPSCAWRRARSADPGGPAGGRREPCLKGFGKGIGEGPGGCRKASELPTSQGPLVAGRTFPGVGTLPNLSGLSVKGVPSGAAEKRMAKLHCSRGTEGLPTSVNLAARRVFQGLNRLSMGTPGSR